MALRPVNPCSPFLIGYCSLKTGTMDARIWPSDVIAVMKTLKNRSEKRRKTCFDGVLVQ